MTNAGYDAGLIPAELEHIPAGYERPAEHAGTLERLDYNTWESFSYESHTQQLTKTAWVYVPYGYDPAQRYDVLYFSHGGWSNETTTMGTPGHYTAFKHVVDHAIEDGLVRPIIIVLPTYNNTSESDSGDYGLALQLTTNFHNELVGDLMPAVEVRFSTYADDVTPEAFAASREHRAFGGFSMGSVNTWHTFEYALPYFSKFIVMSGGAGFRPSYLAQVVSAAGLGEDDFFIFGMSGTSDFAYNGFRNQVLSLPTVEPFVLTDSLDDGNVAFREREGYQHNTVAHNEYTYNGLRLFFNGHA